MSPHVWKMLSAIAIMVLPFGARGQTYDELSAMVTGPWHHIPNALSPSNSTGTKQSAE
jgi:hypothetical protein